MTLYDKIVETYDNFIEKAQKPVKKYIKPIFDEAKEKIGSYSIEKPLKQLWNNIVDNYNNFIGKAQEPVETPSIKEDPTNNVETPINGIDYAWLEKDRNERWEREDQIRKETQEREDNAYQRAIKDAWASGINPNLMNVQPASSGGGITQTQGINSALGSLSQSEYLLELEKSLEKEEREKLLELEKILDQSFKEDENTKDRITDLITSLIMIFSFKGK